MSDIDNGGPAFPNPGLADPSCSFQVDVTGMTMRDWFAGQALAGIMAGEGSTTWEGDAKSAYKVADAMIEERRK